MTSHRIVLWSAPRTVSTAIMYAFAQRADTRVVDEPLYGHYLLRTGAQHPGREDILAAMDTNGERVVEEAILGPCDRKVLFVKNMGHHLLELNWDFLLETIAVMLIRDPVEMLPSLINQVPEPTLSDTAYKRQHEIFTFVQEHGRTPCVVDSRQLLLNPRGVLEQLCSAVGIPFDECMLSWPVGARPEDGVWAPHWYHTLHETTGFAPYRPKTAPFPALLRPLLEECRPYYDFLYGHALRA